MTAERVTVGLVQMRMTLADSAAAYVDNIARLTCDAVARGAQLVAFPEYTGLPLLGLLPGVAQLASRPSLQTALDEMPGGVQVADVFRSAAPAAYRVYTHTFSSLARRLQCYIMAGSIILADKHGKLTNCAHLFGPAGLIGRQAKLHLFTDEEGWLTPGDALSTFTLPCGRVAMPVCMDHTYWETARLAYLAGAEILLDPAAGGAGDNPWYAARGVRMRVQESPCYGLHIYAVNDLFGLHWRGRSSVYAPVDLLPAGQSALAQAVRNDEEEVVICPLDLQVLREYRAANPLEFNISLYEKYLPCIYRERC